MNKFRNVPGKSELSILIVIILVFSGIFAFTKLVRSSSDQVSSVLTERDFADDPGLRAYPNVGIVATFLEPPSAIDEKKDTGAIGLDIIPYEYTEAMEQTFCWDDDNVFSEHTMTLFDSEGVEVFTIMSGVSCVTRTVRRGEYEMHIRHDGKSDDRVAVFIVQGEDESVINTTTDEALENLTTVLNSNKCIGCDLTGINLNGLDLAGIDLSYSILDNAILVDTILVDANLSGASLKNADLSRAVLRGANLSGADFTNAILINSDLSNADLTLANLENADTAGAEFSGATTVGALMPKESTGTEPSSGDVQTRIHEDMVDEIECNGVDLHTLDYNNGKDLIVTGPCTVNVADTYHFRKVNIYGENASLTFADEIIDFWAYGIIVEAKGSLIAGSETNPIGDNGKLTIYLYGEDQGTNGSGIRCKAPTNDLGPCGIPLPVWNSNGSSPQALPGGVTDFFYQYMPPPQDKADPNAYFGYKVLGVSYDGTLRLFGKKGSTLEDALSSDDSGTSWTRLDGNLSIGATQLTVDKPVDWEVGDRIVVTTTDYLPGHSEVVEIVAPVVDDMTFNFKLIDQFTGMDHPNGPGLQYPHNGTPFSLSRVPTDMNIDLKVDGQPAAETRAAVALLSRSIMIVSAGDTFMSDFPPTPGNYFGGHTMVRQGVKEFKVQGVQFHQLGQGAKMGHYPVHFHLTRRMPDGTFVKDSSVTDSMTRWITLHGAQDVTLARNVGFMSVGHGFYLEDGTEINNKLYSNLGILARAAVKNDQNPRQVPGILAWEGRPNDAFVPYNSDIFNPTVFWIMNGWNDFEYNMAAGATGCGVCYWLIPGTNSGHSQGKKWVSYASMQTGQVKTTMVNGQPVPYEENLGRAGMTPLKTFKGNYCTSAMMSFNTVGATDACLGLNAFGPATNPNAPVPAIQPVAEGGKGDPNQETFYPKVTAGGGRFATSCGADHENADCGPSKILNRCSTGNRDNCMVTVLDKYISSFHWPQQNFAAIWLRPQWYLMVNSFLSDTQNGGLGFVTGGDYTLANVVPGQWQLATRSVFVGETQQDNPLASNAGPFNPLMSSDGKVNGLICDSGDSNHCRNAKEGISMPIDNFAVNQRLFNIYDGPNFQDKNAYLDIVETPLAPLCEPGGTANCPQVGPGVGQPAWMYTRVIGIPVDQAMDTCVLPNAAIGWKQPNGFYYPPAFHSDGLFFDNVNIRHYVLEPLWLPGTFVTDEDQVRTDYCTFAADNNFGNFSSVDRQTVVNDDDGSLTGLVSSEFVESISVNLDPFFNAPIEAIECKSFDTAKTSPYEYISTVIYPECASVNGGNDCLGTCSNSPDPANPVPCSWDGQCVFGANQGTCSATWGRPCTNTDCYGVPLERQLLTSEDAEDLSTTGIRMAGMDLYQRSMMTLNGATYYVNTTVSETTQRESAKSLNVFKPNDTFYTFFLYSKASTNQTYEFYVGVDPTIDPDNPDIVQAVRANIATFPITFSPDAAVDWNINGTGWDREYNSTTGILTVTVDMKSFAGQFAAAEKDFCQPKSFCQLNGDNCECSSTLTGDDKAACEAGNICGKWAGKDIDCPLSGCPGFSIKLPSTFEADNKGHELISTRDGHRPDPECFDENESPWKDILLQSAGAIAGDCDMTPIDPPRFCTNPPAGTPPTPAPTSPPKGGGPPEMDQDGDGVANSVDADSDNDGIPDEMETATNGLNAAISTRVEIPADPDGDGIPNELDLDSDGDGLPDHYEAGGVNDLDSNGKADNFSDSDGDGYNDAHDPDQGGVVLPLPDTDGDEIPDFLDKDSDNDNITDTDEILNCEDANDDGILDNSSDADNDGLADSVHPDTGTVCVIQDTDGDGLPDHLDFNTLTTPGPSQEPPDDGDGDDTDSDGGSNGACAIAGPDGVKGGLAGLLLYAIIPAAVLVRRKFRRKRD